MFNPKKEGFFPILYQKVIDSLGPEQRVKFSQCRTLEDRIQFVWDLEIVAASTEAICKPYLGNKSAQRSDKHREAGNAQFHAGKIPQAQVFYSAAVFSAPESGQQLSLAYANRSACLQIGKYYSQALEDIDLAFAAGYPDSKRFKLHERVAECHQSMNNHSEAILAYKRAMESAPKSNLNKEKLAKFVKEINAKISDLENRKNCDKYVVYYSPTRLKCSQLTDILCGLQGQKIPTHY